MAVLRDKVNDVEMTLRPYRVSEEGEPVWILTQLQLKHRGVTLLSTTLSITSEDLAALESRLSELARGLLTHFALTTTDDDFVIEGERMEREGDVSVWFWVGEAYGLRKGYRFVTVVDDLERFAGQLRSDQSTLAVPGQLP